jgi:anti-sigma factor RsiW
MYHDGELPEARRREVETHMSQCPACLSELAEIRELSRQIGESPRAALSGSALQRLHAHVEMLGERSVLRFAGALSAVAASVLVAAMVGLFTASAARTSRPTPMSSVTPAWESAALTFQTDASGAAPASATIETAEWIVLGLSSNGK